MLLRITPVPKSFIVLCSVVVGCLVVLFVQSEWKSQRLKQQLIPTSEFEEFLSEAESQGELNKYYDEIRSEHTLPVTVDNESVEGISVSDTGIEFEEDYVFPDGFFKGLNVEEAIAKLPEIDAQIAEWNAQIEEDMIQFERDKQEIDVMVEQANAHLASINKMLDE